MGSCYIILAAILINLLSMTTAIGDIYGGYVMWQPHWNKNNIYLEYKLTVRETSSIGKQCRSDETKEYTADSLNMYVWSMQPSEEPSSKRSSKKIETLVKFRCSPSMQGSEYRGIYGIIEYQYSTAKFYIGFSGSDSYSELPIYSYVDTTMRPDTKKMNSSPRPAVFGYYEFDQSVKKINILATDFEMDYLKCTDIQNNVPLENCEFDISRRLNNNLERILIEDFRSTKSKKSFSKVVVQIRLKVQRGTSLKYPSITAPKMDECGKIDSIKREILNGQGAGNYQDMIVEYTSTGLLKTSLPAEKNKAKGTIQQTFIYIPMRIATEPDAVYGSCFRIVRRDGKGLTTSTPFCRRFSSRKDEYRLKTEYVHPKPGTKVLPDLKHLEIQVHGGFNRPDELDVAIVEYDTGKSFFSMRVNNKDSRNYEITEDNKIRITLPYIHKLEDGTKYYIVMSGRPYKNIFCEPSITVPKDKDDWVFTAEEPINIPAQTNISGGNNNNNKSNNNNNNNNMNNNNKNDDKKETNKDKKKQHETDLKCEHSSFRIYFKALPTSTMPITKVTLENDRCRLSYNAIAGKYQIKSSFSECSTRMRDVRNHIVYSNVVRVYYKNETSSNSMITRTKSMNIKVECYLPKTQINTLKGNQKEGSGPGTNKTGPGGIVIGPQYIEIHDTEKNNGTFRIDFQVYRSLSYSHSYGREEFPIYLAISNHIYFEVAIDRPNLRILPRTCYATKTRSYQDEPKYYLVQDSCPKDQTFALHQQNTNKFRFSVQAFNFKDGGDSIYVHCHTYVCKNQTNEQCQFGCNKNGKSRSRRSIELKEEVEGYMTSTLEIKINGKKVSATVQENQSVEKENSTKHVIMYLQIPIAVTLFGIIFLIWKCMKQRRSVAGPSGVYYEEEMKLNNKEVM